MSGKDSSTEQKIKEAARKVFTMKGYAATRTRDIAEEAGINLALLNYYFRSKEKLFEEIMMERMQQMFGTILPILMDQKSTLENKIDLLSEHYIDMLQENPDLPIFILSELREHPGRIQQSIPVAAILEGSKFFQQIKEHNPKLHPIQFMMALLGMVVFPFAARPIFGQLPSVQEIGFEKLMEDRKKLVSGWAKTILNSTI
ncbi:MAG: TetR/AcrR family transcriptional regulator [Lewinellaceae bacterium]|nr:TetR/AcrR family transcriptional regulator [Lewinellaceae bacterium]